jgi:hypothetical protein
MRRLMQFSLVFVLFSCSDPPPTHVRVQGKYFGSYGGGSEIIELRGDGTFTQSFSLAGKKIVENTGNWSIEGKGLKLEEFIEVFDPELKQLRQSPKKFSIVHCGWTAKPDQLLFDFDAGYFAIKRKP